MKNLGRLSDMKKKLLVLVIAFIPTLMPNLASAVAIDVDSIHSINSDFCRYVPMDFCGLTGD